MNLRRWRAVLLVTLVAVPAAAHGVFTGEQWRYRRSNLFEGLLLRIAADVVAIPSTAPWWSAADWTVLGGVVGSTALLSAGRPSFDVRFQAVLQNQVLGAQHARVWGLVGDVAVWSTVGVSLVGLLAYGLLWSDAPATETAALLLEAFAVAQLYHQMIKLLAGRAGPNRPELEGQYFGPVGAIALWPSGTPSGHMASMYAMLSVLMYAYDHPALWVGLNAFALLFGASLVGDNYHWASDVLLGAGLGFCVGRWVVQHRSTRYRFDEGLEPVRVSWSVLPVMVPGSGAGVALVGTF